MPRISHQPTFAITLPRNASPLRHRICDALLAKVADGTLQPGDHVPSTRMLAQTLRVSRGAVVAAYDELLAAGYLIAKPGSGTQIATGADRAMRAGASTHAAPKRARSASRPRSLPVHKWSLQPGSPDSTLINRADWNRAWRAAAAAPIGDQPPRSLGHVGLREALSDHLRRSRGVNYGPDDLFILPGVAAAVRVIAEAAGANRRAVAVEDPGYTNAHRALTATGAKLQSARVDEHGIDPASISRAAIMAYTTPANQYPLGSRLSVDRRAELIDWARAGGRTIIEDDYDGEFRYDVSPMPAVASLAGATDVVAYIGTASKILTPTLRIAWLAPPPHLAERVRAVIDDSALDVCATSTTALAHFVASGALTRHLARAARTYYARRSAFLGALRREQPDLEVRGIDAGLHVTIPLPDGTDEDRFLTALAARGVGAAGLSSYTLTERPSRGIICGYARLPESQAALVAHEICAELRSHTR
ncbi:GntR family transcriptional regulator [Antricoccus suffuscus]|uniref:GntR family transcriptional regulator n=1 Tax=Antricoccus suffuscus TaxID=1629062 RepID=A0A2T1A2Z4_9ACTN|nr:PLP-dependent aminotransferase family protein [Antricoccus suffuscus]PRZ42970.1 GntR family transcriptional regulator [Antricoccus suffuscus]